MQMNTGNSVPVSQKPYPIAMKHYDWVKNEINNPLDAKVICCGNSSWQAPIIILPKDDGGKHLVIDYSPEQSHPEVCLTNAQSQGHLLQTQWCTILFNLGPLSLIQIHTPKCCLDPENSLHIVFWKYEYPKALFRLAQAPADFQELMTKVLKDLPFVIAYLDDIIIYSKIMEEHLDHLQQVFHKL